MAKKLYRLPDAKYDPTFRKALAMCIHIEKLEPAELDFWFENGVKQAVMAKEMYARIVDNQAAYNFEHQTQEEYEE